MSETAVPDGERIRRLRLGREWTQQTLARKAGVSKKTVENAEAGKRISVESLDCIAQALDISVEEVTRESAVEVNGEEWQPLRCWVYALLGNRGGRPQHVIGCFQTQQLRAKPHVIRARGRAYWVRDGDRPEFRGEWDTDETLLLEHRLSLYYFMRSPGIGDQTEKPDRHEGIIRLKKADLKPVVGVSCFEGFVHDLFDWRDNSLSIVAEPVKQRWQGVIDLVTANGCELYRLFRPRLG